MRYQILCGDDDLQGKSKPNAYHNRCPYIPDCAESSVIDVDDSEDDKPDDRRVAAAKPDDAAVVNEPIEPIVISSDDNEGVDSKHASAGKRKRVPSSSSPPSKPKRRHVERERGAEYIDDEAEEASSSDEQDGEEEDGDEEDGEDEDEDDEEYETSEGTGEDETSEDEDDNAIKEDQAKNLSAPALSRLPAPLVESDAPTRHRRAIASRLVRPAFLNAQDRRASGHDLSDRVAALEAEVRAVAPELETQIDLLRGEVGVLQDSVEDLVTRLQQEARRSVDTLQEHEAMWRAVVELQNYQSDAAIVMKKQGRSQNQVSKETVRNFESIRRLNHHLPHSIPDFPLVNVKTGEPYLRRFGPNETFAERGDPAKKLKAVRGWEDALNAIGTANHLLPPRPEYESDPVPQQLVERLQKQISQLRTTSADYAPEAADLGFVRGPPVNPASNDLTQAAIDTAREELLQELDDLTQEAAERKELEEALEQREADLIAEVLISSRQEQQALQRRAGGASTSREGGSSSAAVDGKGKGRADPIQAPTPPEPRNRGGDADDTPQRDEASKTSKKKKPTQPKAPIVEKKSVKKSAKKPTAKHPKLPGLGF